MEPFQQDPDKEKHYADVLSVNMLDAVDNTDFEAEMEAALNESEQIGADLGIIPAACKSFVEDPSRLTRWIIGEERVEGN